MQISRDCIIHFYFAYGCYNDSIVVFPHFIISSAIFKASIDVPLKTVHWDILQQHHMVSVRLHNHKIYPG